jgi:16S rRNA C967 or C1407 C5-methylase (RsmB/RsmF family)
VLENEGVVARILEELGESVELVEVEVAEKSKGMVATSFNISDKVARFRPHIHHTGGFFIATFKKHTSFPHPAPSITNNKTQEKFYTEFKADSL